MRTPSSRWWLLLLALSAAAVFVLTSRDVLLATRDGGDPPASRQRAVDDTEPARLRGEAGRVSDVPVAVPIVRGRVVHAESGRGLADVFVLVCAVGEWWESRPGHPVLARVRSGPDGRFALDELPAHVDDARLYVTAWGGGWIPAPRGPGSGFRGDTRGLVERTEGVTAELELEVVASPRVEGRVLLPGGSPAPDAEVRPALARSDGPTRIVYPLDFRYLVEPVRTAADGTFVLETVPAQGKASFEARLDGLAHAISDPVRLASGETTTLEIRFPRRRFARWEVVSSQAGLAIPGAVVSVEEHQPGAGHRIRSYARTDERGTATIEPFPPAVAEITVAAEGFLPYEHRRRDGIDSVLAEGADGNLTARVVLETASWVTGRVVLPELPDDEPVSPTVYLEVRALDAPGYERYRVCNYDALPGAMTWLGADLRFRMPVPSTGIYVLEATLDAFEAYEDASVEVVPGDENVEVRIDLEDAPRPREEPDAWVLDIRGPDGETVSSASFHVTVASGWDEWRLYGGRNWGANLRQADGTWRIPIAKDYAGIWIDVSTHLLGAGRKTFGPFARGGGRRRLDLPREGSIAGRVLRPDGTPLGGVEVEAVAVVPRGAAPGATARTLHGTARTDRRGLFLLSGLGQELYRLGVKGNGVWLPAAYRLVAPGTEGVELLTLAPVAATVTVLGPEGTPLPESYVSADQASRPLRDDAPRVSCSARTGRDGRAVLGRLEAGATYELHVAVDDDALSGVRLDRWTPRDTTIRMARRQQVAGRVVDTGGAPLARVFLGLRDAKGAWHAGRTDREGAFSIADIARGRARIVAGWDEVRPERIERAHAVAVDSGTTDLVLVLPSRRELTVEVDGLRTRRPPRFTIRLWPLGEEGPRFEDEHEASIGREPSVRFRGLEPGVRYLLWGRDLELDRYVLTEVPEDATSVSVPFLKGGRIDGRVLLPERGADDVQVGLRVRGIRVAAALDEVDGAFTIRAVPDGEWVVEARLGRGGERRVATAPAWAGQRVLLDLRAP